MRSLSLLLALSACGGVQLAPPPWREPPPAKPPAEIDGVVYTPGVPAAARYNDPAPAAGAATPLEDMVAVAVAAAAVEDKAAIPDRDARLDGAARELAAFLPEDVTPPHDLTSFVLSWFGIVEPYAYVVVATRQERDSAELAGDIRGALKGVLAAAHYRRLGVGAASSGGGVRVVIALQESQIATEPIPREIAAGGSAVVRGRVAAPLRDPRVFVARPRGDVSTPAVSTGKGGGFGSEVKCENDVGMLKIEIVADDPAVGPVVLANLPVWCGVAPPRTHRVARTGAVTGDARAIEREIFDLMNRDRTEASLAPLAWDDAAAGAARGHSEEMRDKGYVGHVSPTTGRANERAQRAGVRSPLILENVARDYSAREAEAGLMASPGHRANILSPQATHVGVGVAVGGRTLAGRAEVYVTQLLFQKLAPLDGRAAHESFRHYAAAARAKESLPPLEEDWQLRNIAEDYARTLVAGGAGAKDAAAARAGRALDGLSGRFRSVVTLVQVVTAVGDFRDDAIVDPSAGAYGLGLAQGDDPHLGDGALYMVLLLARPR
ncbi:MAG TPA: CAP domain-containing protein [Haliangiales bacterium]|nr:CAP domain-containing protein [Haliangiales bacterium]